MIKELTEAQEAKLVEYRDKWLEIGLKAGPTLDVEKRKAESLLPAIYAQANLPAPKIVIWLRSPMEGTIAAQLLSSASEKFFGSQVRSQVWGQVGSQVWSQVNFCGYGSHDANWLAFYDFFLKECELSTCERLIPLMELSQVSGWWWPFSGACILTERPLEIYMQNKRLHNEHGASIKYSDGFSVHTLNGIRMPEWTIITPRDDIKPRQVLELTNTEQRMALMKHVGLNHFLKELKAKSIDKYKDYVLYYLTIENQKIGPYLFMICPSTGRQFLEGVGDPDKYDFIDPTIKTCKDALKWRYMKASKNLMTKFNLTWQMHA